MLELQHYYTKMFQGAGYVVAYTTARNCYSGKSLSEKKHQQQLSAKVWNSGTTSVDGLSP